ncbi:MAG: aminoacyl-tRNA hydrolase [Rickettsiales bacterium]|jgi:peptidyl-tRNA hydrolase, PTH1 family|nr:aminoacyl-tRNA hydrolase [Rickettsiales bacterium]
MFIIFGLGNPGSKYQLNRHNLGFLFIDYLTSKYSHNPGYKASLSSLSCKVTITDKDVILVKPQTFMNLSGQSVLGFKSFYKIDNTEIIVVHDEIDLKFKQLKAKIGGGNAGHNGLKDISNKIGNDYHRIRIGVDHPRNLGLSQDVHNYVLGNFNKEEQEELMFILGAAEDMLLELIS